ncbi:hypothetical protein KQI65_04955 [bacterium]|nr:hypothetical protein [bacterium]
MRRSGLHIDTPEDMQLCRSINPMPLPLKLMPLSLILWSLLFLSLLTVRVHAQDDLQLFGSMQTVFFHQDGQRESIVPGFAEPIKYAESRSSFMLQQLDLFMRKELGENFTAFVDLEFQLNYSSDKNWGSMSLQEAWMNYHIDDALSIKTGLLYPAFNRLNEIKNRLALLPYIFRPLIYERLLSEQFYAEDFIPEHAFVQIYGAVPFGNFFGDYAVYTGNAEASYISRRTPDGDIHADVNRDFEFLTGVDPTNFNLKLLGGRIGLRSRDENINLGVSLTHDYNNLRDSLRYPDHILSQSVHEQLGDDAPRYRLGADLFLRHGPFSLETEMIKVFYDTDDADLPNFTIEQAFLHGMLGYDVTSDLMTYVSVQYGDYSFGVDSDYYVYSVGGAYRINDAITAKLQLVQYDEALDYLVNDGADQYKHDLALRFVFLGCSILL